jgi:hypothetical protein
MIQLLKQLQLNIQQTNKSIKLKTSKTLQLQVERMNVKNIQEHAKRKLFLKMITIESKQKLQSKMSELEFLNALHNFENHCPTSTVTRRQVELI